MGEGFAVTLGFASAGRAFGAGGVPPATACAEQPASASTHKAAAPTARAARPLRTPPLRAVVLVPVVIQIPL
ncbi:hypothetical protein [Streptomyces sp. NPDC127595]|uniref:hypothetical protein n=1 Tax=Streptomyces sp. NPDC127595 TaxID=3345405 RepID=UPI00362738E8